MPDRVCGLLQATGWMTEDELIAACYEAAALRVPWETPLRGIAERLDCKLAQVIGVDLAHGKLSFTFEGGNPMPEGLLEYARRFHRIDPHAQAIVTVPLGSPVSFSNVYDEDYVDQSPFYQQFLIPYGVRHMHGARLYQDGQTAVMLGLHRAVGKQPIDGGDWQFVCRLGFHLSRAAGMYLSARRASNEVAIGRAALDRIAVPLMLIDRKLAIVQRNNAATALLKGSDVLREDDRGFLTCLDPGSRSSLARAVAQLTRESQAGTRPDASEHRAVVALRRPHLARPIVACLVPLRAAETMGAFGADDVVMLLVHDSSRSSRPDPFLLSVVFDLTHAEARVASLLAEGLSPKEIARRHDVSLNTVQTQIRSALSKVGTNRTAEMVALVGALAARVG
jgi:DNA-binding CsgD family transcriptional regulator